MRDPLRLESRLRLARQTGEIHGWGAIACCAGIAAGSGILVTAHVVGWLILAQIPGAL